MKIINNELIRSFRPCYDPSEKGIPDNETLPVKEWVDKYRGIVPDEDILWLLLRGRFYNDKQLRLFAVWCARDVLKLAKNPHERIVNACDVAERYANGNASKEELIVACDAVKELLIPAFAPIYAPTYVAASYVSDNAAAYIAYTTYRAASYVSDNATLLNYLLTQLNET